MQQQRVWPESGVQLSRRKLVKGLLEGDYVHLDIMEDRLVRSYKLAAKMLISSLKYRVFAFDLQGVFKLLESNCICSCLILDYTGYLKKR